MRVITGSARGRRLGELKGMETRPTTDKVKESIFNCIQFDVEDARVLDLFAGTGQLGIEALSRGAKSALFVDKRADAVKLVRGVRNSVDFDAEQQLSLIYRDVSDGALETVLLIAEPKFQHISSTMVREMIKYGQDLEKYMPLRAAELVKGWREDHGEQ